MWRASSVSDPELTRLRDEILACDRDLVAVMARRRGLVHRIGAAKRRLGLPVTDPAREAIVVRRAAEMAREAGLDEELVRDLIWKLMASSRAEQQAHPALGTVPESASAKGPDGRNRDERDGA